MRISILALLLAASACCADKPNIIVFVADDAGFSDIGCYGSEIATPNLDRLAASGLRFTQFYNTARCWTTRTALMTGYYPQQVNMDPPQGQFPPWTKLLPHYLTPLGYHCYHSGKWHVNHAKRVCADGGFEHSYRLDDHDRHFAPKLHQLDDQPLPAVEPGSGYYTTTAIADYAIRWLKEHGEKHAAEPFFSYVAFTSPHFPIQAPPEDIAKYREVYKPGWEKMRAQRYERQRKLGVIDCALAPFEPEIKAPSGKPDVLAKLGAGETLYALPWDKLTTEQQEFQSAKEAVHAAMVDRMDREIGRVLDQLKAMNALENTVVFSCLITARALRFWSAATATTHTPNPAAAVFLRPGPGGSTVSNTPFRRHKIWTHEGGISTPLIVNWPRGIAAHGEFRRDPGHVIDLLPTLVDLAGGKAANPAGPTLPGVSLVPAFTDGSVKRDCIYFNHQGNHALRAGNWKIVSSANPKEDWELYDLAADRSELSNLAEKEPARLRLMIAKWKKLDDEYQAQSAPYRK